MGNVIQMITVVLIVAPIVIVIVNRNRYRKQEEQTGLEKKNYIFLGMLLGLGIGGVVGIIADSFLPVGIGMIVGEGLGQYLSYPENTENRAKLYKKRRNHLMIGFFITIPLMVLTFLITFVPKKDPISTENLAATYMIVNEDNYVATQSASDCAGYSTAYVIRHLGQEAEGASLFKQMPTFFGRVALNCIEKTLKNYDIKSQSYHGTIDTLKAELQLGNPVIALITITIGTEKGLHYVAVVGYDEEYIYMADSTGPQANIYNVKQYNRRVTYDEFEELWQTNIYPVNNLYVVVKN